MEGIRQPAVAGRFYERSAASLRASLQDCFLHPLGPGQVPEVNPAGPGALHALVSPHAGYMFSGPAAAHGFAALAADGVPETAIILGPSHHASDRRAALSLVRAWQTPLGEAPIDQEVGRELLAASDLLEVDERTHAPEHSLEVQVPFLQFLYGERVPKLVPVCVRAHPFGDASQLAMDAEALGQAIARTLGTRRVVIIASTDLSHQVPQEVARRQDQMALGAILAVAPEELLQTVVSHGITMCGSVPVAIALGAVRALGVTQGRQLCYYTSGDIIGDYDAVVGYASVVL